MQSLEPLNQGMENFFRSREEQGLAVTDVRGKGNYEENGLHLRWEELEGEQTHKLSSILFY